MTEGRRKFVFGGASALLLTACGGGGGETVPAPDPIQQTPAPADPVPTSTPLRYGFRLRVTATPSLPSSASLLDVFTVDPGTGAVRLLRTVRDEEMGVSIARRAQPDPAGRFLYLSGFVGPVLITRQGATGNFETRANDFNMATGEIAASGRPAFYPSGIDAITPDGRFGYRFTGSLFAYRITDTGMEPIDAPALAYASFQPLQMHPSGRWLLAEGPAVLPTTARAPFLYRIDAATGALTALPRTPLTEALSHVAFAGSDRAWARQADGRWTLLSFDAATGAFAALRPAVVIGNGESVDPDGDYVTPLASNSTGDVILVQRGAGQVSLQGYRWNATRDAVAAIGAPLVVPVTAPQEFKLIPDPAGPYFRSAAGVFRVVAPAGVQLTATGSVIPDSWIVTPA